MFVRKKYIKMFLTLNHCFWTKYESIIHNNSSSRDKVHLLLSLTSESRHIFVSSWVCKRCLICADFSPDSDQNTFTGGRVIMDYGLLFRKEAMLKLSFSLHKTLTDGVVWIMWCFISCLDSHSDGTHSLQSIHWLASDLMKKQTRLHLGWFEGEEIFR